MARRIRPFDKLRVASSKVERRQAQNRRAHHKLVRCARHKKVGKGAILLMGLPGVGKGTQAFRLTEALPNFVHFDTGAEIYRRIHDQAFARDPEVQRQKKLYESGILNDPKWTAALVSERIRHYAKTGKGVVLSGSPRTLFEANVILPLLHEVYGDKVLVVVLSAPERTVRQRSSNRLVCANRRCRYPTTKGRAGKKCPQCGKRLPTLEEQKEEAWKVKEIKTRFEEFRQRTLPALNYILAHEMAEVIDAERGEEEIFADVLEAVERRFG